MSGATSTAARERPSAGEPRDERSGVTAWRVAVLGATVLGAALALHGIGRAAFDYDEAYSLHFVRFPWSSLFSVDNGNQALFLGLLKLWHGWATSEATVRLLSWAPFVATIPTTALLARRLFGRRVAVVATFLVATHPLMIRYAQEGRGYAWAAFALTAGTAALVVGVQDGNRRAFWTGVVVLGLAVHLHPATGFGAVPLLAWLWWLPADRVPGSRPWAVAAYAAIVSPFLVTAAVAGNGQIQWVDRFGSPSDTAYQILGTSLPGLVLGAAAVAGGAWTVTRIRRRPHSISSWSAGVPVVIVAGTVAITTLATVRQSFFLSRYLLFLVVPVAMLAATLVRWIPWRSIVLAAFALFVAYQCAVSLERTHDEPFARLDAVMTAEARPGDVLVTLPTGDLTPIDQYHASHPNDPPEAVVPKKAWGDRSIVHPGAQEPSPRSAPKLPRRVWVVEPKNETAAEAAYLHTALAGHRLVSHRVIGSLRLELWEAK